MASGTVPSLPSPTLNTAMSGITWESAGITWDIPVYYQKKQAIPGYPSLTCDPERVGTGKAPTE